MTPNDQAFNTTVAYATAIAGQYGLSEISPEAFATAAFAAFIDGRFHDRPAVAAHVLANKNCFEALITEKSWVIGGPAASQEKLFPLGHELEAAIESAEGGEKLISAIDVGLQVGEKLLAKRRTAYHEAGHAVVSSVLRPNLTVTEVNIIREGDADGVTKIDASPWTREEYWDELCVKLAGRAAEFIKFGPDQIDAGASSDLASATTTAWQAIAVLGLDSKLGPTDLSALANAGGWSSSLSDLTEK
jgi:hypothetical protein